MENYLEFKYIFDVEGKGRVNYTVKLHPTTLNLAQESIEAKNATWTDLDYNKCENCPLNSKTSPKCPVAMGIHHLIEFFQNDISFTKTKVTVSTPERAYYKETSLQQTLSSILGLIIATSGCPHTQFLKPMARFHLPFSSTEETLYRTLSTYLLSQLFRYKESKKFDVELKELNVKYDELSKMNKGLIERIRSISKGDADRNALIVLNCFTSQVQSGISENLQDLKYLFETKK